MFFADKPYISNFFKATVKETGIPVVATDVAKTLNLEKGTNLISEKTALEMAKAHDTPTIYMSSENSIGWISEHPVFNILSDKIDFFKNKLKFRESTQSIFPDLYFRGVPAGDLETIQFDKLPLPFIIKPAVGFFSMGVYKVSSEKEWLKAVHSIKNEMDKIKHLYPEKVFDAGMFIIEHCITGDEFAVDAYYNDKGEPVILGIFEHTFSSDTDVSDRVYITSGKIIEKNLEEFTEFTRDIGKLAAVKKFPVHIELRRDEKGILLPIEVNPMRFGGWCTTPDLTFLAYGLNPYTFYYAQKKPDWPALLKGKEGKVFSIIVLDNSTGISGDEITSFDYEKLLSNFEKPLELRKIDYKQYPVFGFLFTETREENFIELKKILDSDLNEFISTIKKHRHT